MRDLFGHHSLDFQTKDLHRTKVHDSSHPKKKKSIWLELLKKINYQSYPKKIYPLRNIILVGNFY